MRSVFLLVIFFCVSSSIFGQEAKQTEFNGLLVQIPESYEKDLEHKNGEHTVFVWKKKSASSSRIPSVFSLSSNPKWNSDDKRKVSAHVAGFLSSVKKQRANWSQTKTMRGERNGITFWKTSWTGEDARSGLPLKGIVVAALSDGRLTYMAAQVSQEDSEVFLKQSLEVMLGAGKAKSK